MPAPAQPESVGLIGLGLVGSALTARLLAAGISVFGYDIDAERIRQFRELGGEPRESAAQTASAAGVVLLSLPTLADSATVVTAILPRLRPDQIVIDTTTGSPDESARLAARLSASGAVYLEALIGGSSTQVRSGDAILLCGGGEEAYHRCAALFDACFRQKFHLGACGNASRMKLVLNLVLGLNRAVLAEGLSFAASCGIDPARALEILRAGPAYSRVMDIKGRRMIEQDFTPEARLSQHLKDVRIILALGRQTEARLPLSSLHRNLLEEAEAAGYGAADNSAILRVFQNRSVS